jgi:hypothetical protein
MPYSIACGRGGALRCPPLYRCGENDRDLFPLWSERPCASIDSALSPRDRLPPGGPSNPLASRQPFGPSREEHYRAGASEGDLQTGDREPVRRGWGAAGGNSTLEGAPRRYAPLLVR